MKIAPLLSLLLLSLALVPPARAADVGADARQGNSIVGPDLGQAGATSPGEIASALPLRPERLDPDQSFHAAGNFSLLGTTFPAPTAPASKPAKPAKPPKPPFKYESLQVRNGCFVDSVAFYDRYFTKKLGGKENTWCRVLSWGVQEGDFQVGKGHAVAVFAAKDQRLWFFDINFGLRPLDVPFERRIELTDTAPGVFASYPQHKPLFVRYYDDFEQTPPKKRPDFLFYHKNPDVRDATKVAHELARRRPVRIIEFDLKPEGNQPAQTTAATVFLFQAKLCIYLPRAGTHISKQSTLGSIDDLAYLTRIIQGVSPGAANIRWQPGGYWLLPPKES